MNHTIPRTVSGRRIALRFAVGLAAFFVLGGPSPGYIGGCNRQPADPPNPVQFCAYRTASGCARDLRAGRITGEVFEACYAGATPSCAASRWRDGCVPSHENIAICYEALANESRDATLNDDIVECQEGVICSGSATGALTVDPHGI